MSLKQPTHQASVSSHSPEPSDAYLIAGVRGGDEAALRMLMNRFDRLVRYSIYRYSKTECGRDPQWLETVAADSWMGFVQSLRKNPEKTPNSVSAYLSTIAKFKVVSALRRLNNPNLQTDDEESRFAIAVSLGESIDLLADVEDLSALRECINELEPSDFVLWVEVEAILERRWVEAAAALGLSESTLRSKWKKTLERLRACVLGKTGTDFAPGGKTGDF